MLIKIKKKCLTCRKSFTPWRVKGKYCSPECYLERGGYQKGHTRTEHDLKICSKKMKGNLNAYKNGKCNNLGYIKVLSRKHPNRDTDNRVGEHRLIVEKILGRYLTKKEVTHHLNRIRNDNRPENLMAFCNNSAHLRFERGGKYKKSEIIFDGRNLKKEK